MTTNEAPPGRRSRKRRSTRTALATAALDLFEEKGFVATSIEDITERADVARRTFFRHFPSKEAALLPDTEEYEQRVIAALDEQELPLTMGRLLDAFAAAIDAMQTDEALQRRRATVIADNRLHVGNSAWEGFVATRDSMIEHVAARAGLPADDQRIYLAVTFALFALSVSYGRWVEGADGVSPHEEFTRTVEVLRGLLDDQITLG
ncbi:MAG: TetR family transcriptional regulator [Acidimicrobiales bacterium]|nr:TetR family transcriptional regulator [Acidimicrobiales bacterium]